MLLLEGMVQVVIFDFDGVIADSLPVVEKAARKVFQRKKYPLPAISRDDSLWHILMKEMNLNTLQRLRLIKAMKKEISKQREDIPVFQGMRELFEELARQYKVIILSSNSQETISALFKKNNFPELEIISDSSLFGKDKVLKRVFKKYHLTPTEAIYIGDEIRDVEACKRVNVEMIAVTWGYNSEKALRKAGASEIARTPEEILKFVQRPLRTLPARR